MKIKNILLYLTLLFGVLLSSCSGDFLEEDRNPNVLSPSVFWQNEEDIMKGLTSAYAAMQPSASWAIPFERYIVIDNYRSDETHFRADVSSWMSIAMYNNDSNNSVTRTEWTNLYKGINYANQCIDNIPNVPGESASLVELKKQAIAEARFLRAFFYYRLYINFGEKVPIFLHEIEGTEEEYYPDQAEAGVLVNLIESELLEAQNDLPKSYSNESDGGRATSHAAAAVLARFYMFRGEMGKAEKQLEKLIGQFELMENYADNFTGLNKNNKESVLEVQFYGSREGGQSEYNLFAIHLAPFSAYSGGYEEAYPTEWLFNLMKQDLTIDGEYSDRLLTTIIFDDPNCRPTYYEDDKSFDDYHSEGEYFWHKYVTWDPSLGPNWYYSGYNITLIRYAEVLLSYAECLNHRGATTEAIGYINQVRKRANVVPLETTLSKEEVLMHLQQVERPTELALEGVRWYDLIRWGIVEETLKANSKPHVENYIDAKHKLLPIPHEEFLLNPDWEQNPNYSK